VAKAPDLVDSVVELEDRIIDPRGPGDCLEDYEFLVDFGFARLYSAAEGQLVLRQDVRGPRWTLEQFDDMWGSFVGAQAKNGGNENEKYGHKVTF